MRPWHLVLTGLGFGGLSGIMAGMSFDTDTPELLWVAWFTASLGGTALFVGLVAVAVHLGVVAARD
jgi:hypothetical protein